MSIKEPSSSPKIPIQNNDNDTVENTVRNNNTTINTSTTFNITPLDETPITPTFPNAELHHLHTLQNIIPSNVDFDTAAFMLMANNDEMNSPADLLKFNSTSNSPVFSNMSKFTSQNNATTTATATIATATLNTNPNGHDNNVGTPPPFDFDSIGQMLMSPNSTNLINYNSEPNQYQQQATFHPDVLINPTTSPRVLLPSIKHYDSVDTLLNGNPIPSNLFKDYPLQHPLYSNTFNNPISQSPNSKFFTSNINSPSGLSTFPSPLLGIAQLAGPNSELNNSHNSHNNNNNTPPPNLGVLPNIPSMSTQQGLGIWDSNKIQHNELLSNTETLALESFLDSIANEGSVSKASKKAEPTTEPPVIKETESRKRKHDGISPEADIHDNEQPMAMNPPKVRKTTKKKSTNDTVNTKVAKNTKSKEDRKLVHNITEQKRRDMIKQAFEKLHNLIKNSKNDLEEKPDECSLEHQLKSKKRKRKRHNASDNKPMKKFEVLKRSVKEIEILLEKNKSLYSLLNEKETVN